MTDNKLTDNEIITALKVCCTERICRKCVYFGKKEFCIADNTTTVLDLINRLQAENERLHKSYLRNQEIFAKQSLENERLKVEIDFYKHSPMVTLFEQWKKETESEARKEFAERLTTNINSLYSCGYKKLPFPVITAEVDNLLKEMESANND